MNSKEKIQLLFNEVESIKKSLNSGHDKMEQALKTMNKEYDEANFSLNVILSILSMKLDSEGE